MKKLFLLILLLFTPSLFAAMPEVYCLAENGTVPTPDDDGCTVATTKGDFADLWTQIKNDSVANCFSWDVCAHVEIKVFPKTGNWSGGFSMGQLTPNGTTGSITITVPADHVSVIDCGDVGGTIGIETYVSHTHVRGVTVAGMPNLHIKHCGTGFSSASWTATDISISHTYIEGRHTADSGAIYVASPGVEIHDNILLNDVWDGGTTGVDMHGSNNVAQVNAYNNEIVGYKYGFVGVSPGSTYRNNLVGGRVGNSSNGYISGGTHGGNTLEYNVFYATDHCMQPENGGATIEKMEYARYNICGNNTWNLHNEGGGITTWIRNTVHGCPAYGSMTCTAVGRGTGSSTLPQYLYGNILGEARVYDGQVTYLYGVDDPQYTFTDYNALWLAPGPSETLKYGFDVNGYYQTSTEWLAASTSRYDQHSIVDQNPRYVGNPDLFYGVVGRFTCPGCVTIRDKLAFIRKNYMPTNAAFKGTGCSWNGETCTPDGSDIGAVTPTVVNTPGAYLTTSLTANGGTAHFSGGAAF